MSRTPPTKENGSAPNSSPDLEGHEVEAELLVSSAPKASMGFFGKLLRLIKKLFSTHQFQNEQVSLKWLRLLETAFASRVVTSLQVEGISLISLA